MALYIPHSIFHLVRLLCVRPETSGPYYVIRAYIFLPHSTKCTLTVFIVVSVTDCGTCVLIVWMMKSPRIKRKEKHDVFVGEMAVLYMLDRRMSIVAFGHHYGVSKWAVCYIKHIKNTIRGSIKAVGAQSVKMYFVSFHNPFLEKTEEHSNLLTTSSYNVI